MHNLKNLLPTIALKIKIRATSYHTIKTKALHCTKYQTVLVGHLVGIQMVIAINAHTEYCVVCANTQIEYK